MNDEELLRRMTALRAAGATEAEIEAAVAEWDTPTSPLDALGPLTAGRPGADATAQPFHTGAEAREARGDEMEGYKDFGATLATFAAGAVPFGLIDNVPGIKQGREHLAQRAPDVAKLTEFGGALVGGGALAKGLTKLAGGGVRAATGGRALDALADKEYGAQTLRAVNAARSNLAGRTAANTAVGGLLGEAYGEGEGGTDAAIGAGLGAASTLVPAAVNAARKAPRAAGLALRGTANIARGAGTLSPGRIARGVGQFSEIIPPSQPQNVDDLIRSLKRPGATSAAEDIVSMLGPRRLGGVPDIPPKGPTPRLRDFAPRTGPARTPVMEGEAPPLTGSPSVAQQVLEETDDPIVRAMAQQVETPAPLTPKPSVPRGKVTAQSERVAAMKARSLAGDFPKEAELKGLTLAERLEARGGADVRAQLEPRGELSDYLKRHSRGSAQRRGELPFDARMNPQAEAAKQALQEQADAIPPGPEGETLRDALYKQWKALKDEHGRIGPLYHGSPHKFDRFDVSKIGTGEGAQAYGHGLYFAESPDVARQYRQQLTSSRASLSQRALAASGGNIDDATTAAHAEIDRLRNLPNAGGDVGRRNRQIQLQEEVLEELSAMKRGEGTRRGAFYTAELPTAEADDFLLWDRPLSEQSEKVRKAVGSLVDRDIDVETGWQKLLGKDALQAIGERQGVRGGAESALRKAGIRGIKYLDGSSRGAGEGSYNYVVFDDKDVEILNREGKAALGMLAGTAAASGGALTAALAARKRDR